jgi:hypothetical protein
MCRGGGIPYCRFVNMHGEKLQNLDKDWEKSKKILLSIANSGNQPDEQTIALCYLLTECNKLTEKENKLLDDIMCRLENRKVLERAQDMIAGN